MARTEREILNSIGQSIKAMDSSLDITKGPLYNFVMSPLTPIIRQVELNSDRVERLISLDLVSASDNPSDVEAFGNNFRVPRGGGHKERHLQTFYLYSKPVTTIEIPTGTLVSTEQGTFTYRVIQGASFYPENAENYYNADSGRYEIGLMVEALGYGSEYNVPVGRVNRILSSVAVDGTASTSESVVLGTSVETDEEYLNKVEKRFLGLNSATSEGIAYQINEELDISDVAIFKPGDDVFTRQVKRAALDVYVNGFSEKFCFQSISVSQETDEFVLEQSPAKRVTSVRVNGEQVDFVFSPDSNVDTAGSNHSIDKIRLNTSAPVNSLVSIEYTINEDVQKASSLFEEQDLYDSDIYVREPRVIDLNLDVIIKTNTIVSADALDEAREAINKYPKYTMGEVLYVSELESSLRKTIPNISDVYVVRHNIEGQDASVSSVALPPNCIINVDKAVVRIL